MIEPFLDQDEMQLMEQCVHWQTSKQIAESLGLDTRAVATRLNGMARRGLLEKQESRLMHVKSRQRRLMQYRVVQ